MNSPKTMQDTALARDSRSGLSAWSNRILIAALAGILFLTLYPFRFSVAQHLPPHVSPFLLGRGSKAGGPLDIFLNVLLFVPFGFGLSEKLRERRRTRLATALVAFAVAACLSYLIELAQLYIPQRDSGWTDVLTNSCGSAVGFLLFELCGRLVLRFLSRSEALIERCSSAAGTSLMLLIYFGAWFAISIPLQEKTSLRNWNSDSLLTVGSDAPEHPVRPWKGRISRLELWDHALPAILARELTLGDANGNAQPGLRGDFEFLGPGPFRDRLGSLADLVWLPELPDRQAPDAVSVDGRHWLASKGTVRAFVEELQTTRQFAVRVVCVPSQIANVEGRIVSISDSSGRSNLYIHQEKASLVFWFRNPLSVKRAMLAWIVPNVFGAGQKRDILYSYDGSDLSLYIDGRAYPGIYRLSSGTGLARLFRPVKTNELEGYNYIYYALVFFPGGCLLGIAARRRDLGLVARGILLGLGVVLPPLLFEFILKHISGRPFSQVNLLLSLLLTVAGILWINADRGSKARNAALARSSALH